MLSPGNQAPDQDEDLPRGGGDEHHFWAVKACCGHVFCQRCFENRKPNAKTRPNQGLTSKLSVQVDDSKSDVSNQDLMGWPSIISDATWHNRCIAAGRKPDYEAPQIFRI